MKNINEWIEEKPERKKYVFLFWGAAMLFGAFVLIKAYSKPMRLG